MRDLKKEELEKVEKKLRKYIGSNFSSLANPAYSLVLHNRRVFYTSNELMKKAVSIARDSLVFLGTCIGKFTKTEQFRLKITALHLLAMYSTDRIKVKATAEMNYLYGNHVQQAHISHMPPEIRKNAGVLLTTTSGVPLGFGLTSKSGAEAVAGDKAAIAIVRQSDAGEYLRDEQALL